jgi:NAD(P)-dependent dehydrogenase (short-subunit alcohol dehydrogenase family)
MESPGALITGATGFVGQAMCRKLLACGWKISGTIRPALHDMSALPPGVAPCSVGSLGPGTDWRMALSGVEVIVHLAARVHIMKETDEDSLMEFRQVNTHATERLARMAAQTGVRPFTCRLNALFLCDHDRPFRNAPRPRTSRRIGKEDESIDALLFIHDNVMRGFLQPPLLYQMP